MFPTQETATSAETALSQGEHQVQCPTIVQRIADLLRKPQEHMKQQREDFLLTTGVKRVGYAAGLVVQDYSNEL